MRFLNRKFDVVVVGAGILGLAHAYAAASRGFDVAIFERSDQAVGASVRNFGMVLPIAQPLGEERELAMASRAQWLNVLADAGLWFTDAGSLHLAYHEDEWNVLREFQELEAAAGGDARCLSADQILSLSPSVLKHGLIGGLHSRSEINVDPREVVGKLPAWLERRFGVQCFFGTPVLSVENGRVVTSRGEVECGQAVICSGDDTRTLYPDVYELFGLRECKLQMMSARHPDADYRLGPTLAAGLSLLHHDSFADCPSFGELQKGISIRHPQCEKYGIHVMVSQNREGELIIGDSHEYDDDVSFSDRCEIDTIILEYLASYFDSQGLSVERRWHGIYMKSPSARTHISESVDEKTTIVTAVGGAGMTLSFGIADQMFSGVRNRTYGSLDSCGC